MTADELNNLSFCIIGVAMRVHTELGPGLREEVYEGALVAELSREGRTVRQQVSIPITVGGRRIPKGARADLINLHFGLILNFAAPSMRKGIKRVVNGL